VVRAWSGPIWLTTPPSRSSAYSATQRLAKSSWLQLRADGPGMGAAPPRLWTNDATPRRALRRVQDAATCASVGGTRVSASSLINSGISDTGSSCVATQ
jgi:hypothetical protein